MAHWLIQPRILLCTKRTATTAWPCTLSLEEIRPQASHGARGLLQLGFNLTPQDDAFATMRDEYLRLYETHICLHTRLFPGISELLESLENMGIHWGIVTNKPARFTLPLMTQLASRNGKLHYQRDTTAYSKPHPEPMFAAAREVGATPASCLYLGDAERDVEAAVAAGMTALIANYGYLGEDDQPDNWAHTVESTRHRISSLFLHNI